MKGLLSLFLRLATLLLVLVITNSETQKVNLTAIFDYRLIQLLRQTTSAFSQREKSEHDFKVILNELELQNAKAGDACDRTLWARYMEPIYRALFQDNFLVQKAKNDDFAVAILKDKSVMTKVCMSSTEVLECNPRGKCDCLSFLPSDVQAEISCDGTWATESPTVLSSGFFQNPVFLWVKGIFSGEGSSGGLQLNIPSSILMIWGFVALASLVL